MINVGVRTHFKSGHLFYFDHELNLPKRFIFHVLLVQCYTVDENHTVLHKENGSFPIDYYDGYREDSIPSLPLRNDTIFFKYVVNLNEVKKHKCGRA